MEGKDDFFKNLRLVLEKTDHIAALDFLSYGLGDEGAKALGEALEIYKIITNIWLKDNKICWEVAKEV